MGCACSKHAGSADVPRGTPSHIKAGPTSNSTLNTSFEGCTIPLAVGPLSPEQFKQRLVTSGATSHVVTAPGTGFTLRYASVSLRGYYPAEPTKPNQDTWVIHPHLEGRPQQHLFGVFDGHGEQGTEVAQFATQQVRGPCAAHTVREQEVAESIQQQVCAFHAWHSDFQSTAKTCSTAPSPHQNSSAPMLSQLC
jgi:hypothetical protein